MQVRDVMTSDVVTVRLDTPLKEVARLLVDRRISGVPVVAEGRLLGVVSEADFVTKEEGAPEPPSILERLLGTARDDEARLARVAATTAGEAMTSPAITIGPDDTLAQAARLMSDERVNRLPVVESDRLVGIVTRADIVRSFIRGDDEIAQEVRHVLRAVDGLRVESVTDGVVVLSGSVPHETVAETAVRIASAVHGVVSVDARAVTWPVPAA